MAIETKTNEIAEIENAVADNKKFLDQLTEQIKEVTAEFNRLDAAYRSLKIRTPESDKLEAERSIAWDKMNDLWRVEPFVSVNLAKTNHNLELRCKELATEEKIETTDAEVKAEVKPEIETKTAKNGNINFYCNGKRISEADAVQIAMDNGQGFFQAAVHGYYVDNFITKEFASPITAFKWICSMCRKSRCYADGDSIITFNKNLLNGETIWNQTMPTADIPNAELKAYVELQDAKDNIESQYLDCKSAVRYYTENQGLTTEQAEQIFIFITLNPYDKEVLSKLVESFKAPAVEAKAEAEREEIISTPLVTVEAMDVAIEAEEIQANVETTANVEDLEATVEKISKAYDIVRKIVDKLYSESKELLNIDPLKMLDKNEEYKVAARLQKQLVIMSNKARRALRTAEGEQTCPLADLLALLDITEDEWNNAGANVNVDEIIAEAEEIQAAADHIREQYEYIKDWVARYAKASEISEQEAEKFCATFFAGEFNMKPVNEVFDKPEEPVEATANGEGELLKAHRAYFKGCGTEWKPVYCYVDPTPELDGSEEDTDDYTAELAQTFKLLPAVENLNDVETESVTDHEKPVDDFTAQFDKLKAECNAASKIFAEKISRRRAIEKLLRKAEEEERQAKENSYRISCAIGNLFTAKGNDLTSKIWQFTPAAEKLTITTQNGKTYHSNLTNISVCGMEQFGFQVSCDWEHYATYDTPKQVEQVIATLKAAVERGDKEFNFPTADELNRPSKKATADSLARAMKFATERYKDFCRAGQLSNAEYELKLYNICRKAQIELRKEVA